MTKYTAKLPWNITSEDIERLRGLGEVEFTYRIEGPNRRTVIRDLEAEHVGWDPRLGDRQWWDDNLKAVRKSGIA